MGYLFTDFGNSHDPAGLRLGGTCPRAPSWIRCFSSLPSVRYSSILPVFILRLRNLSIVEEYKTLVAYSLRITSQATLLLKLTECVEAVVDGELWSWLVTMRTTRVGLDPDTISVAFRSTRVPPLRTRRRSVTSVKLVRARHGTGSHFVTQRPSDPGIQRPGDPVDPVSGDPVL